MAATNNRTRRLLALGAFAYSISAMFVALSVRDATRLTQFVFYASPPPIAALILAVAGLLWRGRRLRIVAVCSALVIAGVWWQGAVGRCTDRPQANDLKVMLWNCCRGVRPFDRIAGAILDRDADLVGLVESGENSPERTRFWRQRFPKHQVAVGDGGLAVIVRGEIESVDELWPRYLVHCLALKVKVRGRRLRLLVVDLAANPLRSRAEAMAEVHGLVQRFSDLPLILMGDFNTPPASCHFDPLRSRLVQAFEASGRGYGPTWPIVLPVHALDQIWLSPNLRSRVTTTNWTRLSDHAQVITWLSPLGHQ